jgi:ATP-dependent Clp protease ATP-binding subunit ClpE
VIQDKIEDPLTDLILDEDSIEKVHVDVIEEEIVVTKV